MRVLLTNTALDVRAGTELFIRDLATALLTRGHAPVVYSPVLGEVAAELRRRTVPVVDRLDRLGAPPDLIHGQHHLELMAALLHFPRAPAIHVCHGWKPWEELPPRHPRIFKHVAVDETCRDRIVLEGGIPEEKTRVLLNFVDLELFPARAPLPARPRRALVFSNAASAGSYVEVLREACRAEGLELGVVGLGAGTSHADPARVLLDHDLVFAKARAALEALAVGCSVILCDAVGLGPLVTEAELPGLRPLNFGVRTLQAPVEVAAVRERIARYDAGDAARVSARVRTQAGLEASATAWIALYQEVLAQAQATPPPHEEEEGRAMASYLREVSQVIKGREHRALESARNAGREEAEQEAAPERAALLAELTSARQERDALRTRCVALEGRLRDLEASLSVRLSRTGRRALRRLLPSTALEGKIFGRRGESPPDRGAGNGSS